jgi:hypothetical protein
VSALAHCALCGLWLTAAQSCLHIPPLRSGEAGTTPPGAGQLFHGDFEEIECGGCAPPVLVRREPIKNAGAQSTDALSFAPQPFHHAAVSSREGPHDHA